MAMSLASPVVGALVLLLFALVYCGIGFALVPKFDANADVGQGLTYMVLWPLCLLCLLVETLAVWAWGFVRPNRVLPK